MRRLLSTLALTLAATLALASCAGPRPAAPTPTADLMAKACAGAFAGCLDGMDVLMTNGGAGELVAVCIYADGSGDIVLIDKEDEAQEACATYVPDDGMGSRVLAVIRLPES
jgi:hypothetical protein